MSPGLIVRRQNRLRITAFDRGKHPKTRQNPIKMLCFTRRQCAELGFAMEHRRFLGVSISIVYVLSLNAGSVWAGGGGPPVVELPPRDAQPYPGPFSQPSYSELPPIRNLQESLDKNARNNSIGSIANNRTRLARFIRTYAGLKEKYRGLNRLELNKLRAQLRRYANQKQNKALAKNARKLLDSI